MHTVAGAGVTLTLLTTPGKIQFPAVVTANRRASVQSGEEIAAHRAVSAAVDCSTPFVHNSNPESNMPRHKGKNMPATKANSSAAAPRRSVASFLKYIIVVLQSL